MNTAIRFLAGTFRRAPRVRDVNEVFEERLTFGERLADRVAVIGGSWSFIVAFSLFLIAWAILNTIVLTARAFDPFPFIFLNLMLSMVAALQAPIIMMSQNRRRRRTGWRRGSITKPTFARKRRSRAFTTRSTCSLPWRVIRRVPPVRLSYSSRVAVGEADAASPTPHLLVPSNADTNGSAMCAHA